MTAAALPIVTAPEPRLPGVARVALVSFLWLLPFHSLVIAVLYAVVGVPEGTVRAIAAWKETAIAVLLAWVAMRALLSRGPKAELAAPDIALAALFAIAILSLLTANPLFRADLPPGALLYGFRDAVYFMGLYWVGRATPEIAESEWALRQAFLIALVVSTIGIAERIFVSPEMLLVLGVASYMNDFLGVSAYTVGNEWGLPANYWSVLGGVEVRRAGSVFLASQAFALPFLLLMPAATVWALNRERKHPVLVRIGYALIWLGLLLTLTRWTILICMLQVALYFVMFRKPEWAVGSLFSGAVLLAVAAALVPGLLVFIWETLTWQSASSSSHLKDWQEGLRAFLEQPWGHGLGTTDAIAIRFWRVPLSSDSMYFSYAVQLGLAGLLALLATLGTILAIAWKAVGSAITGIERRFSAVVALAALGIFINGVTSIVFSSLMLGYLFFLFAGSLVTATQRTSRR